MPEGPLPAPHAIPTPELAKPSSTVANAPTAPHNQSETIKETLISIVIAFALAFVFRGFVIEAFVIPTGSMAPTLMGAHMRFREPTSGWSWPVGPWDEIRQNTYFPVQGTTKNIVVHDPMSGAASVRTNVPLSSGDRILVLKYLYLLSEPRRYDVIVFKNPTNPTESYIKRLIGLPGEEIALVDGDVFVRPAGAGGPGTPSVGAWSEPGWKIVRKPSLQQLAVWQPVFDSSYTPRGGFRGQPGVERPWVSAESGWDLSGRVYAYSGSGRTELVFDQTRSRESQSRDPHRYWTVDDWYPYNENPNMPTQRFPVSDVRLRAGIEPQGPGLTVEAVVRARRHEFSALLENGAAVLRVREMIGEAGVLTAWKEVARAAVPALEPGVVANVEFWHADQALRLLVNGGEVASYRYDWSPAERIAFATGRSLESVIDPSPGNSLAHGSLYTPAQIRWAFAGAPVRLHRVGLDRDVHYQAGVIRSTGQPSRGTSPLHPLVLGPDQFFACGDNSPASLDGRLWDSVNPWVAAQFDDTVGVVPRDLLMGKAFFVYWPSLLYNSRLRFVPDFGRMRFIW